MLGKRRAQQNRRISRAADQTKKVWAAVSSSVSFIHIKNAANSSERNVDGLRETLMKKNGAHRYGACVSISEEIDRSYTTANMSAN